MCFGIFPECSDVVIAIFDRTVVLIGLGRCTPFSVGLCGGRHRCGRCRLSGFSALRLVPRRLSFLKHSVFTHRRVPKCFIDAQRNTEVHYRQCSRMSWAVMVNGRIEPCEPSSQCNSFTLGGESRSVRQVFKESGLVSDTTSRLVPPDTTYSRPKFVEKR